MEDKSENRMSTRELHPKWNGRAMEFQLGTYTQNETLEWKCIVV